jgi:hypothetical protein
MPTIKDDLKKLMSENKFYLRKINKVREKMKEMEQENKKLKDRLLWKDKEIKAYEKGALNHGQIALRQEEEIKNLKLELKAAQEVSVVYMKRYEQKAGEERKIDEICSRIKCDDKFGHLIGKVPH